MHTGKVVIFHGTGRPLTCEAAPLPALTTGQVLVRNEFTTLCRSDLNTFAGKRVEPTPTILGHEIVGRIVALGPEAPAVDLRGRPLRPGDRVTWAIYAADPDSPLARRGIPQKGPNLFKYGHARIAPDNHLHGGLATHCVLRRHTPVVRLDDGQMPLAVLAPINCAVATVAGSLRLAGALAERDVLVVGAGMLGVTACAMCRAAGARRVVAADVAPERLAVALRFGADSALALQPDAGPVRERLASLLGPEPVDVALDYSGAPDAMETMLDALGVGGAAVLVGATFPMRPVQLAAEQVVRRLLTIRGLHNYNQDDLVAAVTFMEREHARFPFAELVGATFDLETANEAFACALTAGHYRVGVRCD